MKRLSIRDWNNFLSECPEPHLLQTAEWGELKSSFGWQAERMLSGEGAGECGVQILFRQLPLGFSFAYLPKGPLMKKVGEGSTDRIPGPSFWVDVDDLCRSNRAVFLKIEPDDDMAPARWLEGEAGVDLRPSPHPIQPPRTIVVDLTGSEEDILARMKQKTRYNIRLAGKKGIQVAHSHEVAVFHQLMETTGQRDQFGIHSLAYYQKVYDLFKKSDKCALLMASYEGVPVAGMMVFASGSRSWYLYGASASNHRQRMPTYLLQWEAMKWARSMGCRQYDLYGVPDHDQDYLESNFQERADGLWGIYRFKRGFGGTVTRSSGPWDRVYNAFLYKLYLRWIARSAAAE